SHAAMFSGCFLILSGYEAALRCAESQLISPLVDTLRRAGTWDDTLVVIWRDHGEALGAGGEPFHGFSLVDETLRLPLLLLRGPGVPAGLVIDSQVRTSPSTRLRFDAFRANKAVGNHREMNTRGG